MLKPLSATKWDSQTAAHLLNRAGFGGPPAEVNKLAALHPEQAVASLLDYEKIPDPTADPIWAKPDPERAQRRRAIRNAAPNQRQMLQQEEQKLQRERLMELRAWWLLRMAKGPRPLQEKMTLFWHGHFATSFDKVRDAYYMWRQNELFRRLATGNWQELLIEAGKDPAILIWLDQAQSRKDHPNENFAREVMELFALGEGHYTERDVTEAARALTGWSLDQEAQKFMNRPMIHDTGGKTFLGRNGNLDGTDVIEQIVAQPQAAIFITAKIWNFFTGQPPTPELNRALADVFRSSGNNFKPLLRKMFLSEEFYAPSIMGNQVKSPVQWLVGSVRALECDLPPFAANLVRALGQDLFAPPNVKGWDGGLAWITTSNLLTRYNEAAAIINGGPLGPGPGNPNNPNQAFHLQTQMANAHWGGVDVEKIFTEPERHDQEMLLAALEKRLLLVKLRNRQQSALREFLDGKTALTRADIRGAIRLVMSTPEYQVT